MTVKVFESVVAPFTPRVPVTDVLPATVRSDPGVVVPIPTFPFDERMVILVAAPLPVWSFRSVVEYALNAPLIDVGVTLK